MQKNKVFLGSGTGEDCIVSDLLPNETFSIEYTHYKLDVENFRFNKIDEYKSLMKRDWVKSVIAANNMPVTADEFISLFAFQIALPQMYPNFSEKRAFRNEIFTKGGFNKNSPMNLSGAFKRRIAACMETSLVAQMYLQHCGIKSQICCGHLWTCRASKLSDEDIMTGGCGRGAHAYINIILNGKSYIYDPVNPLQANDGSPIVPAIMSYDDVPEQGRSEFKQIINSTVKDGGGVAYLETKDIYNGNRWWLYGFESDSQEGNKWIWRRRNRSAIKCQRILSR